MSRSKTPQAEAERRIRAWIAACVADFETDLAARGSLLDAKGGRSWKRFAERRFREGRFPKCPEFCNATSRSSKAATATFPFRCSMDRRSPRLPDRGALWRGRSMEFGCRSREHPSFRAAASEQRLKVFEILDPEHTRLRAGMAHGASQSQGRWQVHAPGDPAPLHRHALRGTQP